MCKLTFLILAVLGLAEVNRVGHNCGATTSVQVAVVVGTVLWVVLVWVRAGHSFEPLQIHVSRAETVCKPKALFQVREHVHILAIVAERRVF